MLCEQITNIASPSDLRDALHTRSTLLLIAVTAGLSGRIGPKAMPPYPAGILNSQPTI